MKVSNSSYSTHIRPSFVLNKTYNCNMYKFSMLSRDTVSFQAKSKNLVKKITRNNENSIKPSWFY